MKKTCFSILILSLLLATLTACGAQAQQLDEPEPAPQADQIEPAKPVQLSEPEKTEISQEELEAIFESVYTTANHPEDWSVDFQITDEIGKINSAIPDDKKAPSDLRTIYIDWRAARVDTAPITSEEPAPVALPTFDDCNETVYATSTVNVRSGPSTDDEKIGSLSAGDSVTRTGIGTGDYSSWSRVEFSNGTVAYVASSYLSTTKPVAQQSTQSSNNGGGNSTTTSQNTSGSSSTQTKPADTSTPAPSSSSSGTVERTAENNYGIAVPPGHHVEPAKNGGYKIVNDETGQFQIVDPGSMDGYVAGTGQITSEDMNYHDWVVLG